MLTFPLQFLLMLNAMLYLIKKKFFKSLWLQMVPKLFLILPGQYLRPFLILGAEDQALMLQYILNSLAIAV